MVISLIRAYCFSGVHLPSPISSLLDISVEEGAICKAVEPILAGYSSFGCIESKGNWLTLRQVC